MAQEYRRAQPARSSQRPPRGPQSLLRTAGTSHGRQPERATSPPDHTAAVGGAQRTAVAPLVHHRHAEGQSLKFKVQSASEGEVPPTTYFELSTLHFEL